MDPCALDCSQFATDDLLDQLSELAAIVDPVPWRVQASVRAAFRCRSAKSTAGGVDPVCGQTSERLTQMSARALQATPAPLRRGESAEEH